MVMKVAIGRAAAGFAAQNATTGGSDIPTAGKTKVGMDSRQREKTVSYLPVVV